MCVCVRSGGHLRVPPEGEGVQGEEGEGAEGWWRGLEAAAGEVCTLPGTLYGGKGGRKKNHLSL